jgi:hypothetical protein
MKPATALSNVEWCRVLLGHIRHRYRYLAEQAGRQPSEMVQILNVTLPPLRGRFTHLSHDKLYRPMKHGMAYLLMGDLSADKMGILLAALSQTSRPGE